jgi:anti-anti-sigma factor
MNCEVKTIVDVTVLSLSGRLDASNSKEFEDQVVKLIDSGQKAFVANLTGLDYISSAGLRVFLLLIKKLGDKGYIHLCCLQEQVKEVFDISGFTSIFQIFDDEDSAVEA